MIATTASFVAVKVYCLHCKLFQNIKSMNCLDNCTSIDFLRLREQIVIAFRH